MIVTIEISHYPLQNDYEGPVIDFIAQLKSREELVVKTTAMSTYVKGEMGQVFSAIQHIIEGQSSSLPLSATIFKLIPRDLPIEAGYLDF